MFADLIVSSHGEDTQFSHTSAYEAAEQGSLIFIQKSDQLNPIAAVVVTTEAVAEQIAAEFEGLIVCVKDVRLAQALIKQRYHDYDRLDSEWPRIHPSAVIHPSAKIAESSRVGPNVVIGKDVVIGNDVVIRSNSVIEFKVQIGDGTTINPNATIGQSCVIGKRVIVQSGCVIGSEGYGFAKAPDNHYERVPQTGNVVIEDDVFVGSNSSIDRATYGSTVIQRGVKIDNLCHIAHNVLVGEDSLIIAQTGIAGSSKVGKRVIASGQSGILDHQTVADDAVLVHRAGVIDNVPSSGMYGGLPARPMREHTRRTKIVEYVTKRFNKLEAQLKELQANIEPSKGDKD